MQSDFPESNMVVRWEIGWALYCAFVFPECTVIKGWVVGAKQSGL